MIDTLPLLTFWLRLEEAEHQGASEEPSEPAENDEAEQSLDESSEQRKNRKRKEAANLAKIKQSKEFARRKARRIGEPDDDDNRIAREIIYQRSRPMPGQLENCETCSKRFTVTPYSKTGPNGGLLCTKCSRSLEDDGKKPKAKKRGPRTGRRQNQSNLLDGIAQQGALSLAEMLCSYSCIYLWSLPDPILELETNDFQKIFAFMPTLTNVNLRFAGQLKNTVIEYLLGRDLRLKYLQLDAANLVSDSHWRRLFEKLGPQLEALKLSNLDFSLDDETVEVLCRNCTELRRLKLKQCWKVGHISLQALSSLTSLEHLSLDLVQETSNDSLIKVVSTVGPRLHTLSLEGFPNADNCLLETIHDKCRSLSKLRLSGNVVCTDEGFAKLFTGWPNPPLEYVDFSSTRDVENSNLDGSRDAIGLASEGLIALMDHSGSAIQKLNISSCRHVSRAAFEEIFSDGKVYPNMKELDVSFHTVMDDYLISRILQCCPVIKKLVAFACFNVRDVRIPVGVAMIGGLKAQDTIVTEGRS
ncbi:unnamed protein product [Aspergillus oryzae]|uniref:Unnamed protein product n=1 Tax=Aspergillus oryzae var. brunneus TaxID=332754 RepID=A0ABQ6L4S1_ASPOZ|nr:unnamed protein product [Aspergillus oryzae]GMF86903.1 unnamed protein product [Aspergillus oryzae]GMG12811.1 unnamed protein product [Aspergillus oryzae]GMG52991.1 unnamed protein product [Aspergillus oryzae var. brunneus]